MEKITRKDILEKALNSYEEGYGGICSLLSKVMDDITNHQCPDFVILTNRDQRRLFPKYRRIYAIILFHASISNLSISDAYWWDMGFWREDGRLGFLRWLYDQYKNDTEDISKLITKLNIKYQCGNK